MEEYLNQSIAKRNNAKGLTFKLSGCFARPPKPLDRPNLMLLQHLAACGRELGMDITWKSSGGACDGNILAATGLPTADSLGAVGGNIHSHKEYVLIDSLVERTKLSALLLLKLAAGEIIWQRR